MHLSGEVEVDFYIKDIVVPDKPGYTVRLSLGFWANTIVHRNESNFIYQEEFYEENMGLDLPLA